jgi:hypothetical protein
VCVCVCQTLDYFERALSLCQEMGDGWGEAATLRLLGYVHLSQVESKLNPILETESKLNPNKGRQLVAPPGLRPPVPGRI